MVSDVSAISFQGEFCDQDLASKYQFSHWSNMFGHLERPVV